MSTITISLPSQITKRIDDEAKRRGFATRSEFIRSLLRRYLTQDPGLETFEKAPLSEVKMELARTGKYSEKFIESVIEGLAKSSQYEG